jgi:hypothetical protein
MPENTVHQLHRRTPLEWPEEQAGQGESCFPWFHQESNVCLDFHGDPAKAELVVLSDGNHHMALQESLNAFSEMNGGICIFYATTPPDPIVNMLRTGGVRMGNLRISATPHVFISPPDILSPLVDDGLLSSSVPFMRNQGNVLLVKKDNPKGIASASDVLQEDVRLFISNAETEKASYTAYRDTLDNLLGAACPEGALETKRAQGQLVYGQRIHHREAPQAVFDDSADAAMVFHHLALRYVRIFPDNFEFVPLGGSVNAPAPLPGNVVSKTNVGLIQDGGVWGKRLVTHLLSEAVHAVYRRHGLIPA